MQRWLVSWRAIVGASIALAATAGCSGSVSTAPAAAPSPAATFTPATVSALDGAVTKWFAKFKAPGVVVGIWIPSEGSYVVARGKADAATGAPMSLKEHFRVGSITKTFTVTVLLQLADAKRLSLDDPVFKYEPWVPNGKHVTLRMLANMTSGLFSYTRDKAWVKELLANPNRVLDAAPTRRRRDRERPGVPSPVRGGAIATPTPCCSE